MRSKILRRDVPQFTLTPDYSLGPITPRESAVIELIAQGHSNESIGNQLGITDKTVKRHVSSIFEKMGCTNRTEVAVKVLDQKRTEEVRRLMAELDSLRDELNGHSKRDLSNDRLGLDELPAA